MLWRQSAVIVVKPPSLHIYENNFCFSCLLSKRVVLFLAFTTCQKYVQNPTFSLVSEVVTSPVHHICWCVSSCISIKSIIAQKQIATFGNSDISKKVWSWSFETYEVFFHFLTNRCREILLKCLGNSFWTMKLCVVMFGVTRSLLFKWSFSIMIGWRRKLYIF